MKRESKVIYLNVHIHPVALHKLCSRNRNQTHAGLSRRMIATSQKTHRERARERWRKRKDRVSSEVPDVSQKRKIFFFFVFSAATSFCQTLWRRFHLNDALIISIAKPEAGSLSKASNTETLGILTNALTLSLVDGWFPVDVGVFRSWEERRGRQLDRGDGR